MIHSGEIESGSKKIQARDRIIEKKSGLYRLNQRYFCSIFNFIKNPVLLQIKCGSKIGPRSPAVTYKTTTLSTLVNKKGTFTEN